jgi:proteic killer suppression protein
MIKGLKCNATEALFRGFEPARHLRPIAKVARRKLDMIDYAAALTDLRVPPGNRLEALKGDRRGQYSIRINDQWRVCFVWRGGGAEEVEIVDYH